MQMGYVDSCRFHGFTPKNQPLVTCRLERFYEVSKKRDELIMLQVKQQNQQVLLSRLNLYT